VGLLLCRSFICAVWSSSETRCIRREASQPTRGTFWRARFLAVSCFFQLGGIGYCGRASAQSPPTIFCFCQCGYIGTVKEDAMGIYRCVCSFLIKRHVNLLGRYSTSPAFTRVHPLRSQLFPWSDVLQHGFCSAGAIDLDIGNRKRKALPLSHEKNDYSPQPRHCR
jgi:hypothetical protein